MEVYEGMDRERLESILDDIGNVRIALIGDVCIDVYWRADMAKSELSRETPHFPLPVVEEWMAPGAGGNAAANIAALKPEKLYLLSVIGRDWRGDALLGEFRKLGIETEGLIVSGKCVTNAYCKPLKRGISGVEYEDPRIDFCNYEPLPADDEAKLLEMLEQTVIHVDVLCVSDQFLFGCITPRIRERIMRHAGKGLKVIVDSRDRIGLYSGVILKPNEVEGFKVVKKEGNPSNAAFEELVNAAEALAEMKNSSVCMTLGSKGCVYADSGTVSYIQACKVAPPIDICGAGDTFLAAFSCVLATGAGPHEAAYVANLASGVAIRKIGMTGTATPVEIRECYNRQG